MSTQPKTTPMNISPQNIAGTCNYKCAFSFDYPVSSCTATNAGNNITLSYTDSTSPVTFNKTKYNITSCYIYSPSLHSYNNVQADAELFIMHTPTSGGQGLMVCIPISTNGTSNAASNTIGEIMFFKSNLEHYVKDNKKNNLRITMSFDIHFNKEMKDLKRFYILK